MNSIEWFYEKAKKFIKLDSDDLEDLFVYYYQAKVMHKREVMNGFNQGYREGFVDGLSGFDNDKNVEKFDDAENYYKENFGINESGMSEKPTNLSDKYKEYQDWLNNKND